MGLFVCQFLGNLIDWTEEKLMHLPQCGIEKVQFQQPPLGPTTNFVKFSDA